MGRIVVTEFVSVDGVAEDPGGAEGFERGGWAFAVGRGDDGDQYKLDETLNTDAMLLGRVTYEAFADAWPERDGEFADAFNSKPKYVVSTTLHDPRWQPTTVLDGDLATSVEKVRASHDGDIVVHGSLRLVQGLIERDLVDELRLMVFPLVVGAGRRLFADTAASKTLRLTDTRTVGDGVQILTYARA
jgi:dihydrofolate reductase